MSDKSTTQVFTGAPSDNASGYMFIAPMGSKRPVNGTDPLDAAYAGLGYLDDSGVVLKLGRDTEEEYDWGGDLIAVLNKKQTGELTFTIAQRSATAVKFVFGDENVVVDPTNPEKVTAIHYNLKKLPKHHQLAALLMGDGTTDETLDFGDVQVTDIGDIDLKKDGLVKYSLTVKLFADANGRLASHWIG